MLTSGDFVEVYVSLLEAEGETGSQEVFETRREQILEQHDTSREELVRFVEAHADDPEFLATLWDSIEERLQALGEDRQSPEESISLDSVASPEERGTREGEETLQEQKRLEERRGRPQVAPLEQ